jgi:hypothetical protein
MAALSPFSVLGLALVAICTNAFADDESICAVPLNQALMTVRSGAQSNSQSAASTAWQCSFKFSGHDEALNAGLSVGTVVYGVPLKIGGTFDQRKVDQWKDDNCSRSAANSSFQAASVDYLREVAPGAMGAFVINQSINIPTFFS